MTKKKRPQFVGITVKATYTGTMDGQVGFKPSDPFESRATKQQLASTRGGLQTEKKQNLPRIA